MTYLNQSAIDNDLGLLADKRLTKVCIFHPDDFDCVSRIHSVDVIVVFCPYLYHHVRNVVPSVRVVLPLSVTSQVDALWRTGDYRSRAAARLLSELLASTLDLSCIEHWQFDSFSKLLTYYLRWSELGANFSALNLGGKFIVPRTNQPWRYGYYSAIPSSKIASAISESTTCDVVMHKSSNSRVLSVLPCIPFLPKGGPPASINYLPATHVHKIEIQEIVDRQPSIILESQHYHTAYTGTHSAPLDRVSLSQTIKIARMLRENGFNIYHAYQDIVRTLLPSEDDSSILNLQSKLLADDMLKQILLFKTMCSHLDGVPLDVLNLSAHTTSLHGPIVSYAESRDMEINVFPHSNFQSFPFQESRKLKLFSHPTQESVWNTASRTWRDTVPWRAISRGIIGSKNSEPHSSKLLEVSIVLNGTGWSHTCQVNLVQYLSHLMELISICRELGLQVSVRSKPNANFSLLLANYLNDDLYQSAKVDAAEDSEFPEGASLIIMFDSDTSFGIRCLEKGLPLISVSATTINPAFDLLYYRIDLVPHLSIYEAALKLKTWMKSESAFRDFKNKQHDQYLSFS